MRITRFQGEERGCEEKLSESIESESVKTCVIKMLDSKRELGSFWNLKNIIQFNFRIFFLRSLEEEMQALLCSCS